MKGLRNQRWEPGKDQQNVIKANADNADLMPLGSPQILIGCVGDVNGEGARDFPQFVPTRAELLELLKFWEDVFLGRAYFIFTTKQIGGTDLRLAPFAERRVTRIVDLLGKDAVDAVAEVRKQFAREIGERQWRRFSQYLGTNHRHNGKRAGGPAPRRPNAAS